MDIIETRKKKRETITVPYAFISLGIQIKLGTRYWSEGTGVRVNGEEDQFANAEHDPDQKAVFHVQQDHRRECHGPNDSVNLVQLPESFEFCHLHQHPL